MQVTVLAVPGCPNAVLLEERLVGLSFLSFPRARANAA
jgi:hypothetical protein